MTLNPSNARRWLQAAVAFGVVYLLIGLSTGELAGRAGGIEARNAWRMMGWAVSFLVFAAHIVRERLSVPASAAFHVAVAVAVGAFGLAVAATIHALRTLSPDRHMWLFAIALVAWPVLTTLPAYVVAFVASVVLGRVARQA